MLMLFFTGCDDGIYTDKLDVPYFPQERNYWCSLACIQMWAHYDGHTNVTQMMISNDIPAVPNQGTIILEILRGIQMFTNSIGDQIVCEPTNLGQDICIASCIASIKDNRPAIVPFNGCVHSVLATGFQWHYEKRSGTKIRIADFLFYHDPDPAEGRDRESPASELKMSRFLPFKNKFYFVIVGSINYRRIARERYNIFISEGGTFYGGPTVYDPLSFDYSTY